MKRKLVSPAVGVPVLLAVSCIMAGCGKKPSAQKSNRSARKVAVHRLDQAGGVRLEFHFDFESAVENRIERIGDDIYRRVSTRLRMKHKLGADSDLSALLKTECSGADLKFTFLKEPADVTIASSPEVIQGYRDKRAPVLDIVSVDKNKGVAHFRINPDYARKYKDDCLKQALKVVRKRLHNLGVPGGTVTRKGDRLILEVRGVGPVLMKRLKNMIGRTGRLEFKIVDDQAGHMSKVARFLYALTDARAHAKMKREELLRYFNTDPKSGKLSWKRGLERIAEIKVKTELGGTGMGGRPHSVPCLKHKSAHVLQRFFDELPERLRPPANREIGYGQEPVRDIRGRPKQGTIWRTYYLHRVAGATGKDLEHAAVGHDQYARPEVHFRFGREGEKKFRALTRANIRRRLAIIVDRTVRSAPVIQSEIGAKGRISLGGGLRPPSTMLMEAKDLAALLRAGALPAPLVLAREVQIGPRSGRDAPRPGRPPASGDPPAGQEAPGQ